MAQLRRPPFALLWGLLVVESLLVWLAGALNAVAVELAVGLVGLFAMCVWLALEFAALRQFVTENYPDWWRPYSWIERPTPPQLGMHVWYGSFIISDEVTNDPALRQMRRYYVHLATLSAATALVVMLGPWLLTR